MRGNGVELIHGRRILFRPLPSVEWATYSLSYWMLPFKVQLAKAFHETHSFKWDPTIGFTLASGLKSPFYVDCRSLMAHPGSRHLVASLAYESWRPVDLDC